MRYLLAALIALPALAHDDILEPSGALGYYHCTAPANASLVCVLGDHHGDVFSFEPDASRRLLEYSVEFVTDETSPAHDNHRVVDAVYVWGLGWVYAQQHHPEGHDDELHVKGHTNQPVLPASAVITAVAHVGTTKVLALDAQSHSLLTYELNVDAPHSIDVSSERKEHGYWTLTTTPLEGLDVPGDMVVDAELGLLWTVNRWPPQVMAFDANGTRFASYSVGIADMTNAGNVAPYGIHYDKSAGQFYVGDRTLGMVVRHSVPDTSGFVKTVDF